MFGIVNDAAVVEMSFARINLPLSKLVGDRYVAGDSGTKAVLVVNLRK